MLRRHEPWIIVIWMHLHVMWWWIMHEWRLLMLLLLLWLARILLMHILLTIMRNHGFWTSVSSAFYEALEAMAAILISCVLLLALAHSLRGLSLRITLTVWRSEPRPFRFPTALLLPVTVLARVLVVRRHAVRMHVWVEAVGWVHAHRHHLPRVIHHRIALVAVRVLLFSSGLT